MKLRYKKILLSHCWAVGWVASLCACTANPPLRSDTPSPAEKAVRAEKAKPDIRRDAVNGNSASVLKHYDEYKLKNGIRIIWIRDDALPSISLGALLTVGSSQDPVGKSGITDLMAHQMVREAPKWDSVQVSEQLGMMGADVGAQVDHDWIYFQASGLSQYRGDLATIFSDMLLRPTFRPAETARLKRQALSELRSRTDDPGEVASEIFSRDLYLPHPYGRLTLGRASDLAALRGNDLLVHYRSVFAPDRLILVVAGRSDAAFVQQLRSRFESYENSPVAELKPPPPPTLKATAITYAKKAGLVQAQIRMGHLGIERKNPDFLSLKVAMSILGGGFSSRLVDQVRDNLGLTYSIASSMDGRANPGTFEIETFTQLPNVGRAISESLTVLNDFVAKGVTPADVSSAQQYLIGRFPQSVETAERLGLNLALLRRYGISDDYLIHYADQVTRVTAATVNAAIRAHLNPERMKIVVLASGDDVLNQLRLVGPVEVTDGHLE